MRRFLCLDLGHLAYSQTGASQQEQNASLSSIQPSTSLGLQIAFQFQGGKITGSKYLGGRAPL